jgi:RND family efflux transporter MFP subunit
MTALRRSAPRTGPAFAAAAVVLAAALNGCSRGGDAAAEPADAAGGAPAAAGAPAAGGAAGADAAITVGPENVVVVERAPISSGPTLSGSLTPERSASIRAEVGGTVTAVYAEAGQPVQRGRTLARVETSGIAEQAASARAGVASARSNYELARRNAERAERLLAAGAIASRDAEQARTQADAARSQVSAAQAQFAQAQRQLGSATATAPFSGIVGTRSVSVGDVVAPGAALYTVVDPSSMQLTGNVPADQLGQVRVGAPVTFSVTGYPGRDFTGRIIRIAPVADPTTRQVQVIAAVPNAGNRLVGGLFAQGRVASETRDALVVPADAVDQRGVRPQVVRVRAGRAEPVPVEIGLRDEASERVEVRGAVAAGDTLLRGAAQGLTAGTLVRVSTPTDQSRGARQVAPPAGAPARTGAAGTGASAATGAGSSAGTSGGSTSGGATGGAAQGSGGPGGR